MRSTGLCLGIDVIKEDIYIYMNIMAWIVLILNGLSAVVSFIGIFVENTTKRRVKNAVGFSINSMTIYLMLYILGFII